MSTQNDGGSWGAQYSRAGWQVNIDGDSAPFPTFGGSIAGSTATPIFESAHGPMVDPDFAFAARESAWVPMDGEMFWFAGKTIYDKGYPAVIPAELAAWRLREMHCASCNARFIHSVALGLILDRWLRLADSTLSHVHGFAKLDEPAVPAAQTSNETITRWMRTPLDVLRLRQDRLPISPIYAAVSHSGYEYVRDHLGCVQNDGRFIYLRATAQ